MELRLETQGIEDKILSHFHSALSGAARDVIKKFTTLNFILPPVLACVVVPGTYEFPRSFKCIRSYITQYLTLLQGTFSGNDHIRVTFRFLIMDPFRISSLSS